MGGSHHEKVAAMHKPWTCTGSAPRVCSAQPGRCFSPSNLNSCDLCNLPDARTPLLLSHSFSLVCLSEQQPPIFFSCPGPSGYWRGDNSFFFSQQRARKDDRTCVRGQGTGLNWFRGEKWSCVFSPLPSPSSCL